MTPKSTYDNQALLGPLTRIAEALERLSPPPPKWLDLASADAFIWQAASVSLEAIEFVNRVPLSLLQGVDRTRDILMANTQQFAEGRPANNALLWGARGMGKSSLIKAIHAEINGESGGILKLIEIHREDIASLPALMKRLREETVPCLIFCDDLSFDHDDAGYKSLKAVLDGGLEGRPENVLFYATSNRRHLMPRDMMENERSSAIVTSEAVEEKVSLSDRFGLWLGFHNCNQDEYLAMVTGYAGHFGLKTDLGTLHGEAIEWSATRGARSGRVAWQFIQDCLGKGK